MVSSRQVPDRRTVLTVGLMEMSWPQRSGSQTETVAKSSYKTGYKRQKPFTATERIGLRSLTLTELRAIPSV